MQGKIIYRYKSHYWKWKLSLWQFLPFYDPRMKAAQELIAADEEKEAAAAAAAAEAAAAEAAEAGALRKDSRSGGGGGRGWGWGDVSVGFFPMTRHAHCFSFLFCFPTAGQVRSIVGAHSRTACTRVATWALDAVRVRGARAAAPRWTAAEESWEAMEKAISSRRPWLCRREVRTCSLCCLNSQKILERRRLCGFIQK